MEKIKSCMFKLYELRDEMAQAIEANDNVINQQIELADIVDKAEKKNDFTDFTKGLREQISDYEIQRKRLVDRRELIAMVIAKYEKEINDKKNKASETDSLVSMLLVALGVCNPDDEEKVE